MRDVYSARPLIPPRLAQYSRAASIAFLRVCSCMLVYSSPLLHFTLKLQRSIATGSSCCTWRACCCAGWSAWWPWSWRRIILTLPGESERDLERLYVRVESIRPPRFRIVFFLRIVCIHITNKLFIVFISMIHIIACCSATWVCRGHNPEKERV